MVHQKNQTGWKVTPKDWWERRSWRRCRRMNDTTLYFQMFTVPLTGKQTDRLAFPSAHIQPGTIVLQLPLLVKLSYGSSTVREQTQLSLLMGTTGANGLSLALGLYVCQLLYWALRAIEVLDYTMSHTPSATNKSGARGRDMWGGYSIHATRGCQNPPSSIR